MAKRYNAWHMYFPFTVERLGETRVECPVGTLCDVGHYLGIEAGQVFHVAKVDGKISVQHFTSGKRWVDSRIKEHDGKIVSDCTLPIYYHDGIFTTVKPPYPTILKGGIYIKEQKDLTTQLREVITALKKIVDSM